MTGSNSKITVRRKNLQWLWLVALLITVATAGTLLGIIIGEVAN